MPYINAMFYGVGGSGKTTLAATFEKVPEWSPVLMLNLMGNPEEVLAAEYPDLYVVDIAQLSEIDEVFNYLAGGQKSGKFREKLGIPESVVFKTVVFDTFTEVQRIIINQASGLTDASPATAGGKMSIQTWGEIQTRTLRLGKLFIQQLQMNTIFLVYEKSYITLDAMTNTTSERRPCLDGSAGEILPGYIPLVGRIAMALIDKEYIPKIIWRSATGSEWTKNQLSPALASGMINPTAAKIYAALKTVYPN
jgi:hypothetical protein